MRLRLTSTSRPWAMVLPRYDLLLFPMTSLGIGRPSAWTLVLRDLKDGLLGIHVWPTMAWYEIRQRYRRSALGPFWLTISTGVLVAAMGPLYGRLFGQEVSSY